MERNKTINEGRKKEGEGKQDVALIPPRGIRARESSTSASLTSITVITTSMTDVHRHACHVRMAFLISRAVALLSVDHREKPTSGKICPRRRSFLANIIFKFLSFYFVYFFI